MKIVFKDTEDVVKDLEKKYQQADICRAKKFFIRRFRLYGFLVYSEILGKKPPMTFEIRLVNDVEHEGLVLGGCFDAANSRKNRLFFTIYKNTFELAIRTPYSRKASCVVLHEMLHAADCPALKTYHQIQEEFIDNMNGDHPDSDEIIFDRLNLLIALRTLNQYRAEGVALLGEHLLTFEMFDKCISTERAFEKCRQQLETTRQTIQNISEKRDEMSGDIVYDDSFLQCDGADNVMLKVLAKKGIVDEVLIQKALNGVETGHFDLTNEEAFLIIRAALSIRLEEYVCFMKQLLMR